MVYKIKHKIKIIVFYILNRYWEYEFVVFFVYRSINNIPNFQYTVYQILKPCVIIKDHCEALWKKRISYNSKTDNTTLQRIRLSVTRCSYDCIVQVTFGWILSSFPTTTIELTHSRTTVYWQSESFIWLFIYLSFKKLIKILHIFYSMFCIDLYNYRIIYGSPYTYISRLTIVVETRDKGSKLKFVVPTQIMKLSRINSTGD